MEMERMGKRKRAAGARARRGPPVLTAKFSKNGDFYATGGKDQTVRVWSSSDGSLATESFHHVDTVRDLSFSKDDSWLSSCDGHKIVIYDVQAEMSICGYKGGCKNAANAIKFNESGSAIVSAGSCVCLWDTRSSSERPMLMQTFDTFKARVTSLCLRGGTEILAGSLDGSVQMFDLRNDKRLSLDLGSPLKCISMGNRGTCIVASRQDSTLQLLHVETDSITKGVTYRGHTSESSRSKLGCCFTKDTTHVVGGSEDGRIFIWDLVSQEVVWEFDDAHSAAVTSVDYHPTDDSLLSASMDGSIVLWKDAL